MNIMGPADQSGLASMTGGCQSRTTSSRAVTGITKKQMDPWSGDHLGFFNTLGSVVRTGPNQGKRSYAAGGYYETSKDRPNLKVLCETLVSNVVLDGATATGVKFTHDG